MKKIRHYIKSVLSSNSDASWKRVMGTFCVVAIVAIVFVNAFTGKAPDDYIFSGLVTITIATIGGVAVENLGSIIGKVKSNIPFKLEEGKGIPKANL